MSLPPTPHLPRIAPALRGYAPLHPSESSRGSATTTAVAAAVFDSLCLPHPPPIPRPQTAAATRLTPDGAPQPHPKPKPIHPRAIAVVGRSRDSVDSSRIIITGQPTASSPKCPLPTRLAPLILPSAYLREHASESGSTISSTLSPDSYMTAPSPPLETSAPPFPRGFDPDSRGVTRERPRVREDDAHIEEV